MLTSSMQKNKEEADMFGRGKSYIIFHRKIESLLTIFGSLFILLNATCNLHIIVSVRTQACGAN